MWIKWMKISKMKFRLKLWWLWKWNMQLKQHKSWMKYSHRQNHSGSILITTVTVIQSLPTTIDRTDCQRKRRAGSQRFVACSTELWKDSFWWVHMQKSSAQLERVIQQLRAEKSCKCRYQVLRDHWNLCGRYYRNHCARRVVP